MNFEEMKQNKELYQVMWGKLDLNKFKIVENGKSHSSYSFKNLYEEESDSKEKTLNKIFHFEDPVLFHKKFVDAVSGFEKGRILTLHSSSLCALLFFYNVTKENPLEFPDFPNIEFTKSYFEFKTPVLTEPSNMDVLLTGINKVTKRKVVLFLESKFSEYLKTSCELIGLSYLNTDSTNRFYNEIFLEQLNLKFVKENNEIKKKFIEKKIEKEGFKLEFINKNQPFYIDGIKQLISHYIGICNFARGNISDKEKREIDRNTEIYFAEILFDKNIMNIKCDCSNKSYYEMYSEKYTEFVKLLPLNELIEIKPNVLTYSSLLKTKHKFEKNIIEFYFGNK